MTEFTIGCDPEIFIKDENGNPVSAHGLIPGDKKNPHKTSVGAIQVDGTALEFNTDPVPLGNFEVWNKHIVITLKELKEALSKNGKFSFNLSPVQDYTEEYLASLPKEATELGCDPDYCAYTLDVNPRPDGDRPFRTGAGHIHLGWGSDIPVDNQEHHGICASVVKMLDATVGLFMTVIDREPRRRELYGKAGAYRAKPYGVEYRFPSNVWLRDRETRKVVFDLVTATVAFMQRGYVISRLLGVSEEDVREILNNGDHERARKLLSIISGNCEKYFNTNEKFLKEFPNG